MTNKDLNNWIMYHEIHQLARLGFSKARIARYLGLDGRTVGHYLSMSESEYEHFRLSSRQRSKKLSPYEDFVKDKLTEFADTPAAQMHDWLKEHHPDFPHVPPRTVYNFVMYVRSRHNIPIESVTREFSPVEQLPWGQQAQVDFGAYTMRRAGGGRKKVYFFVMVLSRSRMKYVWFSNDPFTAESTCRAHEQGFAFLGGLPNTMVYDQDRIMVVDENMGQILLTAVFKQYVASRSFKLHFCRKADPQSKGKVENVVGYVKKNFLYNRPYWDLQILNSQAIDWLARTANALPHNITKESPESLHRIEQAYLTPYNPIPMNKARPPYHVRKDNLISYKSNSYSLPQGTYRGRGSQVLLEETQEGTLALYSTENTLICTHELHSGKGKTIINSHHRRDTSKKLDELIDEVAARFSRTDRARAYLTAIKDRFPRYTRDHMQCIAAALAQAEADPADRALAFCLDHGLYSGREFEQVFRLHEAEASAPIKKPSIKLLDSAHSEKAAQAPQTSNLQDYETIINPLPKHDKIPTD